MSLNNAPIDPVTTSLDETRELTGNTKPGWEKVLDRLLALSDDQIKQRRREVRRQLRSNGIAYNAVTQKSVEDRPWSLDLIPLVIEPEDWSALSDALIQRAQLKRLLLQDLYGSQRVLKEGVLPPALVYAHSGFLRVAAQLPEVKELPIYSADVSRSPSGDWYVADDICQVPDGIGYALENRLVTSRTLPKIFRNSQVQRIASYFRTLQNKLAQCTTGDERCVILAYGVTHPNYFEYAFLAKYLGYTLVELTDLTVRDDSVYLKTIAGLQRVDVILRFIRDQDTDPLAVNNNTHIGIPGLLHAVYSGNVQIINPLGVGALENPAFNAYLQPLARFYLGEDAKLLTTPTYWLGDPAQRAIMQVRSNELLYRDINTLGALQDPMTLCDARRSSFFDKINATPERFVAQERIYRSDAPCFIGEARSRRQLTLRGYLIDNNGDYQILDGGLCVLDNIPNGGRPPRDQLEASKDVWVLSSSTVTADTLLPGATESLQIAMLQGELPSRVADNLFWLGRYAESAENTIRVLYTTLHEYLGDDAQPAALGGQLSPVVRVLLKAVTEVTGTAPGFNGLTGERRLAHPERELRDIICNEKRSGTLANTVASVRNTSNQLRDRLSPELMRVLNDLEDHQATLRATVVATANKQLLTEIEVLAAVGETFESMLVSLAAFTGLVQENLTHGDNWRFLMMGKRVERARQSVKIIRVFLKPDNGDPRLLENLLRLFDSTITYRARYRSQINSTLALHLLLLAEDNPRSVAYQFRRIDRDIRFLPGKRNAGNQDPLLRLATAGLSRVRLADMETLLQPDNKRQTMDKFLEVLESIPENMTTALTAAYFTHSEIHRSLVTNSLMPPATDEFFYSTEDYEAQAGLSVSGTKDGSKTDGGVF